MAAELNMMMMMMMMKISVERLLVEFSAAGPQSVKLHDPRNLEV